MSRGGGGVEVKSAAGWVHGHDLSGVRYPNPTFFSSSTLKNIDESVGMVRFIVSIFGEESPSFGRAPFCHQHFGHGFHMGSRVITVKWIDAPSGDGFLNDFDEKRVL